MADTGQAAAAAAQEAPDTMTDIGPAVAASSSARLKRALDADSSKEEQPPARRGPPQHFAASSAKQLPHLHRDVLQSIFAFLRRWDFARLTRISKEWRSTAVQMPSCRWPYVCSTEPALHRLLASPLRRHVSRFEYQIRERGMLHLALLPATQLTNITDRMAHLDELGCRIELTPGMPPPHWPPKLTKLSLVLELETAVAEEVAALMSLVGESLVRQAPLVEEFAVRCVAKGGNDHPISGELLSPLVQWPLKKITCRQAISSSAYPILRRMAHLTSISLFGQEEFVSLLSADGPVPPLEEIQLDWSLAATDATVPLLLKLPTLRKLNATFVLADPTPLVPVLHHLHTLVLTRQPTCQSDSLVSALHQATQLTALAMVYGQVTEAHLAAILPAMRQLKRLYVSSTGLRSLEFLSHAPHLAETLNELVIYSGEMNPAEVRHLRPLRALVEVCLHQCFTSPLDASTLAQLTPGGAGFLLDVWPHLRTFRWTPKFESLDD